MKQIFTKTNGYPSKIVYNAIEDVRRKWIVPAEPGEPAEPAEAVAPTVVEVSETELESKPYICLPYRGVEGEKVLQAFKKSLRSVLPDRVKPRFVYKGTKIGSFFSVKDKVEYKHQTNLVYGYVPKNETALKEGYIGQTKVRIERRTQEHAHLDKKSAIYKNSQAKNLEVSPEDFKILEKGFPNLLERRIAESLYVKEYQPKLNDQKDSYRLKLFN